MHCLLHSQFLEHPLLYITPVSTFSIGIIFSWFLFLWTALFSNFLHLFCHVSIFIHVWFLWWSSLPWTVIIPHFLLSLAWDPQLLFCFCFFLHCLYLCLINYCHCYSCWIGIEGQHASQTMAFPSTFDPRFSIQILYFLCGIHWHHFSQISHYWSCSCIFLHLHFWPTGLSILSLLVCYIGMWPTRWASCAVACLSINWPSTYVHTFFSVNFEDWRCSGLNFIFISTSLPILFFVLGSLISAFLWLIHQHLTLISGCYP